MPLPETIRVKLSSEAAGSVSLTPVVAQDLPLADLLAIIMTVAGEDPSRVEQILRHGSIVSGATRYRWNSLAATFDEIAAAVAAMPQSDPSRPFHPPACVRAVIHSGAAHVEVQREAASRRRLLRRSSFWDALLRVAASGSPQYIRYIHRDKEDRYTVHLDEKASQELRAAAALLKFSSLAAQIARYTPDRVDFYVARI